MLIENESYLCGIGSVVNLRYMEKRRKKTLFIRMEYSFVGNKTNIY